MTTSLDDKYFILIVLGQSRCLRPSLGAQAPECVFLRAEPNYCPYSLASYYQACTQPD